MTAAIDIIRADITTLAVDAVVNAANSALRRGGGVDGAIHRAAGPELQQACSRIGGCPTGEARITEGFALPARWVIHAVGPVWHGGGANEDALLADCYRNALLLAEEHHCRSVAFPAISTGIYGFPVQRAAQIAVDTVIDTVDETTSIEKVVFCCFAEDSVAAHRAALDASRAGP